VSSEEKNCLVCDQPLSAWAEMDSDTGKSFSAKCPYCGTYVVPEGMIPKLQAVVGDRKWLLSGTVNIKFTESKAPVVITDELIASVPG
jgi:hypothetical protein